MIIMRKARNPFSNKQNYPVEDTAHGEAASLHAGNQAQ